MSDLFTTPPGAPAPSTASNVPVQSVSDVAQGVKRTVEAAFGRVKIRGEVSRPNYHRSGHLYLTLKDERAVIDAVSWKGQAAKLGFRVEEGMEVIATGKLTTYPGGSKYQIVIDSMEIAGEGALLKMLEDRRKKLAAEGLFDDGRKQALPMLPTSIGVVTSPTGAVIRDILHRLADRFPRDVLLWPVSVQGDAAAGQIARAIDGFNALPQAPAPGEAKRPDVLIVGRGGGSLEDLWCFNEEVVVRAVARSKIPVISAVGHETDTTLIDFVADRRAPTPTGAAEMAVPVRADERIKLGDLGQRLAVSLRRKTLALGTEVQGLGRGLGQPQRLVQDRSQAVDLSAMALERALQRSTQTWRQRFEGLANRLPHPREKVRGMVQALGAQSERFWAMGTRLSTDPAKALGSLDAPRRMRQALHKAQTSRMQQVESLSRVLASVQNARDRLMDQGYIYAQNSDGGVIARASDIGANTPLTLHFRDGHVPAVARPEGEMSNVTSSTSVLPSASASAAATFTAKEKPKRQPKTSPKSDQGTLL